MLDSVTIEASAARFCVIWLHGLGADGYDFEPIVPELNFANKAHTRFIFPHAPVRSVTINMGMNMRAWYDILETDLGRQIDLEGIRESAGFLSELVSQQMDQGIKQGNIVLAGFSQGGVISLYHGLADDQAYAGILALSTYYPGTTLNAGNSSTPVMMMHGSQDPVIPLEQARKSYELILSAGIKADWKDYPMPHSVCPQQIQEIGRWLDDVLTD